MREKQRGYGCVSANLSIGDTLLWIAATTRSSSITLRMMDRILFVTQSTRQWRTVKEILHTLLESDLRNSDLANIAS